jgi:hypothetical protein
VGPTASMDVLEKNPLHPKGLEPRTVQPVT